MFIGWFHDGHSDKVWVAFYAEDHLYCAWGRRGAKLQFKSHGYSTRWRYDSNLRKLIQQKKDKGYQEVDNFLLFSLFPDFKEKIEEELLVAELGAKVR
jgi:predicted DNA-binding WGR domain protein